MGGRAVRVTPDTNVLLRAIVGDHEEQSPLAHALLEDAEVIALTIPALCEVVWVLRNSYGATTADVIEILRRLLNAPNVVANRSAVEAGLTLLEAGGDFADGVIPFEGAWLGADAFMSFDRKAVKLLERRGVAARLLA